MTCVWQAERNVALPIATSTLIWLTNPLNLNMANYVLVGAFLELFRSFRTFALVENRREADLGRYIEL
jgi:hypothetical protein